MGFRLRNSGVLYLKNLVDRLEQFCTEPRDVRNKLESEVTLDRIEFHDILCGSSDGYDHAKQFLKIFQSDEEKKRLENERFAALRAAKEEIDEIIRSNQSLTMKVQDCLNQIDQQDAMIKKLEQDLRGISAEKEREKLEAAYRLQHEMEALAGRHSVERESLMTVITLAETLRLQLESELTSHESMHQAYKIKRDVEEELLRETVRLREEEVEEWKRRHDDIEEQFKESRKRIMDLENAAVYANSQHAQQARASIPRASDSAAPCLPGCRVRR